MRATAERVDELCPDTPEGRWLRHFVFLKWVLGESTFMAAYIANPCREAPLPLSAMKDIEFDWFFDLPLADSTNNHIPEGTGDGR